MPSETQYGNVRTSGKIVSVVNSNNLNDKISTTWEAIIAAGKAFENGSGLTLESNLNNARMINRQTANGSGFLDNRDQEVTIKDYNTINVPGGKLLVDGFVLDLPDLTIPVDYVNSAFISMDGLVPTTAKVGDTVLVKPYLRNINVADNWKGNLVKQQITSEQITLTTNDTQTATLDLDIIPRVKHDLTLNITSVSNTTDIDIEIVSSTGEVFKSVLDEDSPNNHVFTDIVTERNDLSLKITINDDINQDNIVITLGKVELQTKEEFIGCIHTNTVDRTITSKNCVVTEDFSSSILTGVEVWMEDVKNKDIIYPDGNVQYRGEPVEEVSGLIDSDFDDADKYCAYSENNTRNVLGKGYKWSTLASVNKDKLLASGRFTLVSMKGSIYQLRYRLVTIDLFQNVMSYRDIGVLDRTDILTADRAKSLDVTARGKNITGKGFYKSDDYIFVSDDRETYLVPLTYTTRVNDGVYSPVIAPNGVKKYMINNQQFGWLDSMNKVESLDDIVNTATETVGGKGTDIDNPFYNNGMSNNNVVPLMLSVNKITNEEEYIENLIRDINNNTYLGQGYNYKTIRVTDKEGLAVTGRPVVDNKDLLVPVEVVKGSNHLTKELSKFNDLPYNIIVSSGDMLVAKLDNVYFNNTNIEFVITKGGKTYLKLPNMAGQKDKVRDNASVGTRLDLTVKVPSSVTNRYENIVEVITGDEVVTKGMTLPTSYNVADIAQQTIPMEMLPTIMPEYSLQNNELNKDQNFSRKMVIKGDFMFLSSESASRDGIVNCGAVYLYKKNIDGKFEFIKVLDTVKTANSKYVSIDYVSSTLLITTNTKKVLVYDFNENDNSITLKQTITVEYDFIDVALTPDALSLYGSCYGHTSYKGVLFRYDRSNLDDTFVKVNKDINNSGWTTNSKYFCSDFIWVDKWIFGSSHADDDGGVGASGAVMVIDTTNATLKQKVFPTPLKGSHNFGSRGLAYDYVNNVLYVSGSQPTNGFRVVSRYNFDIKTGTLTYKDVIPVSFKDRELYNNIAVDNGLLHVAYNQMGGNEDGHGVVDCYKIEDIENTLEVYNSMKNVTVNGTKKTVPTVDGEGKVTEVDIPNVFETREVTIDSIPNKGGNFGLTNTVITKDELTMFVGDYHSNGTYTYQGAVHRYTRTSTNDNWKHEEELRASDGSSNDYFGRAVCLDEESKTLIVGASEYGSKSGKVYLYSLNDDLSINSEIKTLTESNITNDRYGEALNYDNVNKLLFIASTRHVFNSGAEGCVYVYKVSNNFNTITKVNTLKMKNKTVDDRYGNKISILPNNKIAIGASLSKKSDNTSIVGKIEILNYNTEGTTFNLIKELNGEDSEMLYKINGNILVNGDYAYIAESYASTVRSIMVYKINENMSDFKYIKKYIPEKVLKDNTKYFGWDFAIVNENIYSQCTNTTENSANFFQMKLTGKKIELVDLYDSSLDTKFLTKLPEGNVELYANSPVKGNVIKSNTPVVGSKFGSALAVNGNELIIGEKESSKLKIFNSADHSYSKEVIGDSSSDLGSSITFVRDYMVVGASADDTGATDAGAVKVYEKSGSDWSLVHTITNPKPVNGALYGNMIKSNSTNLFVSNHKLNTDKGAIDVYSIDGEPSTWKLVSTINGDLEDALLGSNFDVTEDTVFTVPYYEEIINNTKIASIPNYGGYDSVEIDYDGKKYFLIVNYTGDNGNTPVNSTLHELKDGKVISTFNLTTNRPRTGASFNMNGKCYIILGAYHSGSSYNVSSPLYEFNGTTLTKIADMPNPGVVCIRTYHKDGKEYIVFANNKDDSGYSTNSSVYEFDGSNVKKVSDFATKGAYKIEMFEYNNKLYGMVIFNYDGTNRTLQSKLYEFNGPTVTEIDTITTIGPYEVKAIKYNSKQYIVISNQHSGSSYNLNSILCEFDGTNLIKVKDIPTIGAAECVLHVLNGKLYIAIANAFNGSSYDINSYIYEFDGTNLTKIDEVNTKGTYNMTSFEYNNKFYLVYTGYRVGSNRNNPTDIYEFNGTIGEKISLPVEGNGYTPLAMNYNNKVYILIVAHHDGNYTVNSSLYEFSNSLLDENKAKVISYDVKTGVRNSIVKFTDNIKKLSINNNKLYLLTSSNKLKAQAVLTMSINGRDLIKESEFNLTDNAYISDIEVTDDNLWVLKENDDSNKGAVVPYSLVNSNFTKEPSFTTEDGMVKVFNENFNSVAVYKSPISPFEISDESVKECNPFVNIYTENNDNLIKHILGKYPATSEDAENSKTIINSINSKKATHADVELDAKGLRKAVALKTILSKNIKDNGLLLSYQELVSDPYDIINLGSTEASSRIPTIAVDGDYLCVNQLDGNGKVLIYKYDHTKDKYKQIQTIEGTVDGSLFGRGMDIKQDILVIQAPVNDRKVNMYRLNKALGIFEFVKTLYTTANNEGNGKVVLSEDLKYIYIRYTDNSKYAITRWNLNVETGELTNNQVNLLNNWFTGMSNVAKTMAVHGDNIYVVNDTGTYNGTNRTSGTIAVFSYDKDRNPNYFISKFMTPTIDGTVVRVQKLTVVGNYLLVNGNLNGTEQANVIYKIKENELEFVGKIESAMKDVVYNDISYNPVLNKIYAIDKANNNLSVYSVNSDIEEIIDWETEIYNNFTDNKVINLNAGVNYTELDNGNIVEHGTVKIKINKVLK